jgi:hypothetical protein
MNEPDDLEIELSHLPTPTPPVALVERVRRLAHLELASRADESLNRMVLAFLLVFSWTLATVGFAAVSVASAGTVSILGAMEGATLSWSLAYFAAAWVSGATLFVVLGLYHRKQRRFA